MKVKLIILFLAISYQLSAISSLSYAFVAAPTEDVKNTRHNLSSAGPAGRTVTTAQTTEICVFCHTPHGANPDVATPMGAPIWNRRVVATGYQLYDQVWSKSFEGTLNPGAPTGFSRLCLSCHDGTIALGRVINPPGSGGFVPPTPGGDPSTFSFSMNTAPTQTMPAGGGSLLGDTRLLGTDLRNDHPISFIFDSTLSSQSKDDELQALETYPFGRDLFPVDAVSLTNPNVDPDLAPLKRHVGTSATKADTVQCTSCHNPHQKDFPKFLRADRIQTEFPTGPNSYIDGNNNEIGSPPIAISQVDRKAKLDDPVNGPKAIICVFCHDKPGVPYGKSDGTSDYNTLVVETLTTGSKNKGRKGLSTHFTDPTLLKSGATDLSGTTADQLSSVINQTPTPVSVRQRACLACHDPHTEQGSIRLLRAGADNFIDTTSYLSENSPTVAIEQTCYLCHSPTTATFNIIDNTNCGSGQTNFDILADCPPDVLTQFKKDAGTDITGDAFAQPDGNNSDPAFSLPEFTITDPTLSSPDAAITGVNSDCFWNSNNSCGSAMNLRLGPGHQPVFTNWPREGIANGDENPQGSAPPLRALLFGDPHTVPGGPSGQKNKKTNDFSAGVSNVNDTRHVECVDCHNMHRVRRDNRFKGMPGVAIALDDTLQTKTAGLIVAQTLNVVGDSDTAGCPDANNNPTGLNGCKREPYVYEVCLRCHGNTFNWHVKEQKVFANGTGLDVQLRGNNPQPASEFNNGIGFNYTGFPIAGVTPTPTSTRLGSGSNKRKEFDPNSKPFFNKDPNNPCLFKNTPRLKDQTPLNNGCAAEDGSLHTSVPNNGLTHLNTAFHPVARQGRNQSGVLNKFLGVIGQGLSGGQLLGGLSSASTIQCTDCHNTNLFGTFVGGGNGGLTKTSTATPPSFPGSITYDGTRGTPWKRNTDLNFPRIWDGPAPYNITNLSTGNQGTLENMLRNPTIPQGPHGSIWRRILRANYDTTLGTKETGPGTNYVSQRFALCFNCHAEEAFQTNSWATADDRLTNFYRAKTGNLHAYHLGGMAKGACHECHYNVHSNIESGNTLYVGIKKNPVASCNASNNPDTMIGDCNPGHEESTHLINFAPSIGGNTYQNPVWGYGRLVNPTDTINGEPYTAGPGCNLKCHGEPMVHNYDPHDVASGGKCVDPTPPSGIGPDGYCQQ